MHDIGHIKRSKLELCSDYERNSQNAPHISPVRENYMGCIFLVLWWKDIVIYLEYMQSVHTI